MVTVAGERQDARSARGVGEGGGYGGSLGDTTTGRVCSQGSNGSVGQILRNDLKNSDAIGGARATDRNEGGGGGYWPRTLKRYTRKSKALHKHERLRNSVSFIGH